MNIEFLNIDHMKYMKTQPDKFFDLAIVDPPYFKGPNKQNYYRREGNLAKGGNYKTLENWDIPNELYFKELIRVSENQIIWGVNYYAKYVPHLSRIVWDKGSDKSPFSQAEIASWNRGEKVYMFRYTWNGMIQQNMKNKEKRIHPTQKPVALYRWLLENFAKKGQRILDTHLGSGSSAIAAHYFGCDFTGCEIDQHYYSAAKKRFKNETRQMELL